jgi:hypothetical protein
MFEQSGQPREELNMVRIRGRGRGGFRCEKVRGRRLGLG